MTNLSLELVHALDLWPFIIAENTCAMKQYMTAVFEMAYRSVRRCLLDLD